MTLLFLAAAISHQRCPESSGSVFQPRDDEPWGMLWQGWPTAGRPPRAAEGTDKTELKTGALTSQQRFTVVISQ